MEDSGPSGRSAPTKSTVENGVPNASFSVGGDVLDAPPLTTFDKTKNGTLRVPFLLIKDYL